MAAMKWETLLHQLDITRDCKRYKIPLAQCPSFLFIVISCLIIASIVIGYALGLRYVEDPMVVALAVILLAGILVPLNFAIVKGVERLAEANILKTEFLDIMSHQLRTPLSANQWVVDLFFSGEAGKIGKEQEEYLKLLKENNDKMAELVSELLVISRIEHNSLPLHKEKVSLQDLVEEVIEEVKERNPESKDREISFSCEGEIPPVKGSPPYVKLAARHLIENAVTYGIEGGRVRVLLAKRGGGVYFEVEDDGVGIPREDQKHLFAKFYRSGNALRYQTEGSGLGLYITKALIEQHGGNIGFRSEEGKGSTFWFTLPIYPRT